MKSHIIINLIEQDFGCEGRPQGMKAQTEATLRDMDGNIMTVTVEDDELVRKGINEGDWVHFTSDGEIVKE